MEFMHIVEAWGTGIPRIINRCNEYGLPEPVFEEFGNGFKVVLFKKVSNTFEDYIPLLNAVGATDIYINNIRIVYEHCRVDTLFGQTNVMEWLNCSKSKATNVMNVLKMANAIEKVKGFGPGKYRFLDLKDEYMKINRFMIAAPKSGSGKTMITCALLQLLKDSGKNVLSYKCGPDYIDPMFHKKVLGVPSKNLDTFFTDEKTTVQLFLDERADGDFAVLEGVMGLYDGLGGIYEQGSSYHLAKVTQTPIILVVDAKGMGKSVLALIAGFLQYDTQHLIKGVLLNRMSKGYYDIIKPLIEKELSVKVVGYFPEQKDIGLSSRHLGLVMPDELTDIKKQLNETADRLKKTIDMDLFMDIAAEADEIGDSGSADVYNEKNIGNCDQNEFSQNKAINTVNIAVAMDEAFCFYYEDNLRLLEKCGAKLQYFSPLHDTRLPKDCDAMLLGGGYPELYAKELSKNVSMLNAIKKAFRAGMPTVAECGGFMYLHTYIHNI